MEPELVDRAREAYERARLRRALLWVVPAVAMGGIAWAVNGSPLVAIFTLILAAVLVGVAWRGGELSRGVPIGLAAGSVTASYPLLAACSVQCSGVCAVGCTTFTAGGAAIAGLLLLRSQSLGNTFSALIVASLVGAMGCVTVGLGGLVGVAVVVAVGAASAATAPLLRPA